MAVRDSAKSWRLKAYWCAR